MSTFKDLENLWGRDLVAELRRRGLHPEDLSHEERNQLWDLLTSHGCVLEQPERGLTREDIAILALSGASEPTYRPRSSSGEEAAGSTPQAHAQSSPRPGPSVRAGGGSGNLPGSEEDRDAANGGERAHPLNTEATEAVARVSTQAQPPPTNRVSDQARGGVQPTVTPQDPMREAEMEINRLRSQLLIERAQLEAASLGAERSRLNAELENTRAQRRLVESSGQAPEAATIQPTANIGGVVGDSAPIAPVVRGDPVGPCIKSMMKLITPADRFSGKDDRNVEEDLSIFQNLCEANLIPTYHWAKILYFCLKGDARRFVRTQDEDVQNDFPKLRKALKDRYLSPEKLDRVKSEYLSLKLKDFKGKDAIDDYGGELLRLHKFLPKGYATQEALIDKLIQGTEQEAIMKQFRTSRPSTFAAAIELARVWRNPPKTRTLPITTPSCVRSQAGPSTNVQTQGGGLSQKGGQSRGSGNSAGSGGSAYPRNSTLTRRKTPHCGLCGREGHWTRECPDLSEAQRAEFNKKFRANYPFPFRGGNASSGGGSKPPPWRDDAPDGGAGNAPTNQGN